MLTLEEVARVLGGEIRGDQVLAPGPGHSADDRSMSIKLVGNGTDDFVVHSFSGNDPLVCRDYVRERLGRAPFTSHKTKKIVATFDYCDENGELLFQVCRYEPKAFLQRRPDGKGGWIWGVKGVRLVPYRLPELIEAVALDRRVFVVEGEKCADTLAAFNITATANPGGAGKWRSDFDAHFTGARVVILPDNDQPGADHAQKVAAHLAPVAVEVRILELPGLKAKGDVVDWLAAGGTAEALHAIAADAPIYRPLNGANTEQTRFPLVRFDDLKPTGAPDYLIKDLIPRDGLAVFWGPPKCGKSFLTFDMAMHIAQGWDYRGRKTYSGVVVYCAFEGGSGFGKRAEAFRRRHHVEPDVPFFLMAMRIDLIGDHRALMAAISAQNITPRVVVLDTLNRSLVGSENKDEDMTRYINAADAIREAFGCLVIIVHHCGVNDSRPRGHTSLTGAVDAQIAVRRDCGNRVVATVEWLKDGAEGGVIVSELEVIEVGTDDDDVPITSCVVVPAENGVGWQPKDRVSGRAKIALELLKEVIADAGETASPSNHIPTGTRTVSLPTWRAHYDRGTVANTDKPDSRRRAFVRHCEKLQSLGLIGIWNDHVWLVGQSGQ